MHPHTHTHTHTCTLQEESGLASIEVAVGSSPSATDVMPFTPVPSLANYVQIALPRQGEGRLLYVTARATNGVGLSSTATSDGVRMICSPEQVGCSYDGFYLCV